MPTSNFKSFCLLAIYIGGLNKRKRNSGVSDISDNLLLVCFSPYTLIGSFNPTDDIWLSTLSNNSWIKFATMLTTRRSQVVLPVKCQWNVLKTRVPINNNVKYLQFTIIKLCLNQDKTIFLWFIKYLSSVWQTRIFCQTYNYFILFVFLLILSSLWSSLRQSLGLFKSL